MNAVGIFLICLGSSILFVETCLLIVVGVVKVLERIHG